MSLIEFSPKVTLLSDFNIGGVLSDLFINPKDKLKVAAITFFFNNLEEGIDRPGQRAGTSKLTKEVTVDQISYRLEMMDNYKGPFFKGTKYDHQALLLAVILDDSIANIHIPAPDEDDFIYDEDVIKNIPNALLQRASLIFDNTTSMTDIRSHDGQFANEASFLSQINMVDYLDDYLQDFDQKSEQELRELHNDLPMIKSLVRENCELGYTILNFASDIERKMPDFDGKQLIESLRIEPNSFEAKTVKFVFDKILEFLSDDDDVQDRYEFATQATLAKTEYRLSLLKTYAPEFFGGSVYDYPSLILAALADTYLGDVNNECEDGNFDFDVDTTLAAQGITDQANELAHYSQCLPQEVEHESLFMAHLFAASEIYKHIDNSDEFSLKQLEEQRESFTEINKFIASESAIGKKLLALMDELDEEIFAKKPSADIIPLAAFRLSQAPSP